MRLVIISKDISKLENAKLDEPQLFLIEVHTINLNTILSMQILAEHV